MILKKANTSPPLPTADSEMGSESCSSDSVGCTCGGGDVGLLPTLGLQGPQGTYLLGSWRGLVRGLCGSGKATWQLGVGGFDLSALAVVE